MKHPHAEIIKSWADGAQIQVKDGQNWYDIDEGNQIFSKHFECRIKPAEPEREPCPETDLTNAEIREMTGRLTQRRTPYWDDHREMINEALRKAWGAGQIVTRAEFDRAVGDRQKRDMAVAEAVAREGMNIFGYRLNSGQLYEVIAEIK